MAGNDIRVIESDAFSVARFWDERVERRVTMTSCNLGHVDPDSFRSLPGLTSLRVSDNRGLSRSGLLAAVRDIATLKKLDTSSGCSVFQRSFDLADLFRAHLGLRLTELVVTGNGIRTVGANLSTAAEVDTIRSLDLTNNELATLGGGLLELRHLERLVVKGNRLSRLTGGSVAGLDRLVSLDVSENQLEIVDEGALRSLTRLRHVDLAGNRIRTLSASALPPDVQSLTVADNRLGGVPFMAGLGHLRSVDASGNSLARLDAHVFSARRHFRSSPPISANFSRNEISSVDGSAFSDVEFSVLDLARNRISRLSHYGARAVGVLRADDNIISDVDDQAFQTSKIRPGNIPMKTNLQL